MMFNHTKPLALALASMLALAGCFGEEEEGTEDAAARAELPDVAVSQLGQTAWPPAALLEEGAASGVGTTPFAENNMIVLDMSGSMAESSCSGEYSNRSEAAKQALFAWLAANPGDNVGLVSFSNGSIDLNAPLGRGEAHSTGVVNSIRRLQPSDGTPLLSAMTLARQELENQAARQGGLGAYRMIVITDGEASRGENPEPLVRSIADNPANMIELHTIGFCITGSHALNDPGRVFYTSATSPEDLRAGLDATQGEANSFDPSTLSFEELSQ